MGYCATKAVSGARRVSFPSVVGTPDKARFSLSDRAGLVLVEPEHVQVGAEAVAQSRFLHRREDRRWVESDEWYYLVLAAMSELSTATHDPGVRLVTGLPVAYYDDRTGVRDRLLGTHRLQREGRHRQRLEVVDCRVIPQPFGALLAATLDEQGRIVDRALATGDVGVIDIGGKTSNFLNVKQLTEVGRETSSVSVGVWDAVRAMRRHLEVQCPDLVLRDHQVVEAIIARTVKYFGERVDLAGVVDEILEPLADQVGAEATQLWNGGGMLDAILVSGGGALLLGPYMERFFRHARVVEDAVFANAVGFWRFCVRVAR